jgi:hypothetical protein
MKHLHMTASAMLLGATAMAAIASDPSTPRTSASPAATQSMPNATTRCPPGSASSHYKAPNDSTRASHATHAGNIPAPGMATKNPPCH